MLHRFPPPPEKADASFITGRSETFAKLKTESAPGQRTVLMTEHTLIFVLKGQKLLHLPDTTITASPGEVILLRKGIYVMAEYIQDGLDFEAVMLFLPGKLLRSVAIYQTRVGGRMTDPGITNKKTTCLVFPATPLINSFKSHFRHYFNSPIPHAESLLPLKQQEILYLLQSGIHSDRIQSFILSAVSAEPTDIDFIVNSYLLQPVTIEELAGLANCSLAKFKRDFQTRYQCSPAYTSTNNAWPTHACS
ncbi:AraC family transcriptional regulator N-terminal domain-containing protein [Puia sp. P3]|uniref:AraC family transcriptional regulator N-terminal domain-containing protein n=1 Tax=Puia sp. P3 TaxID=3423952 RepID=UPI003D66C432